MMSRHQPRPLLHTEMSVDPGVHQAERPADALLHPGQRWRGCLRHTEWSDPARGMGSATVLARQLGARGSRADITSSAAAPDLPGSAGEVLHVAWAWWTSRAEAAGPTGRWLDVDLALETA